jgi:hypothetical protein
MKDRIFYFVEIVLLFNVSTKCKVIKKPCITFDDSNTDDKKERKAISLDIAML